jgi:hypothetical protein
MTRIAFPLIIAALIASAVPAIADDSYAGVIKDSNRSVPVNLTLQSVSNPGQPAGQIRFGEPWACGFGLEFAAMNEQIRTYSLKGAGAGRCASLNLGFMNSRSTDDGGLQVELFNQRETKLQEVLLRPATK